MDPELVNAREKSQNPTLSHPDSDWTFILTSLTLYAMLLDRVSSAISGHPKISGFTLALANMIPVIGVIIWEWSLFDVVALYWAECVITGLLNIPKMALARVGVSKPKPLLIGWFLIHFSLFCTIQAFFVFLLSPEQAFQHQFFKGIPDLLGHVMQTSPGAFLILFLSHSFSFFWNFIGQRKYRTTDLQKQIYLPYERLVIWQVLVSFGAFAIAMLGTPPIAVLALIAGKTALDLGFHFFAHGSYPEDSEAREANSPSKKFLA